MSVVASPALAEGGTSPHFASRSALRRALAFAIPVGLIATLFVWLGRLGFQPTDDGNLLAQTWRLLHGEIPHRDVIFARPMGSAVLHLVDYAVPMPLFEAARLIGVTEFVAYSMLFAWLVFDLSPSRWGPTRWLVAGASVLANMHTYFLTGWYTTDGLVFVALGFVSLRSGLRGNGKWLRIAGLLALGVAPVMKQSFFLAPVLGVLFVTFDRRTRGARTMWFFASTAIAALPLALYLGVLAVGGAARDFVEQITGAKAVWGASFVTAFGHAGPARRLGVIVGATLVFLIVARVAKGPASGVVIRLGMTGLIVWALLAEHLDYRRTWGLALVWTALLVVLWKAIVERSFDSAGVVIVAAGWMTSLSWGYEVPNLVAGAAALYVLDQTWRGAQLPSSRSVVAAATAVALVGSGLVTATSAHARYRHTYGDRPAGELTESLSNVSTEFGSIRTNPNTANYMSELARCVRRYPAERTAVLPDNPGIYPALQLRNPFPIDWMYIAEIEGHEDRILRAARRLDGRGGFLVLFQTFRLNALPERAPLPRAEADGELWGGPLMPRIRKALHGTPVVCGYFVGVYSPG